MGVEVISIFAVGGLVFLPAPGQPGLPRCAGELPELYSLVIRSRAR